jgi:hypothetical protein
MRLNSCLIMTKATDNLVKLSLLVRTPWELVLSHFVGKCDPEHGNPLAISGTNAPPVYDHIESTSFIGYKSAIVAQLRGQMLKMP